MQQYWKIVCLMLLGLSATQVSGETVPCLTSRADCMKTGFTSISIINNAYRCCAPGYSMSMFNAACSCTKVNEVKKCMVGPKLCQTASSLSSDGAGNTLCCPDGYGISVSRVAINGQATNSCTCTRSLLGGGGGGGSVQVFNGNGMMGMFSGGGNVNATAVTQRMHNWQRRFQEAMRQGSQYLSHGMRAMATTMQAMRNHMSSLFANVFRGF